MTQEQKNALTTDQRKALQNASILAGSILPGGKTNMNKMVS